ncbi:hypothetical protein CPC08DRAFT_767308 [Agrocybe pediades]|nr:hypothetical protein CPC08DRAFT_767308 [Agrocybe pediades]
MTCTRSAGMDLHERFASLSVIHEEEKYWIALQPSLLGKGYKLRPRYDPAWQPPCLRKKDENWVSALAREEALEIPDDATLDAIRVQDDLPSSGPMKKDPRNCCVPILDVLLTTGDD